MQKWVENPKVFIKDLKDKDQIQTYFLVQSKSELIGKNGKPFISCELTDNSGKIDARIWDRVEELRSVFDSGDFVFIKGHIQNYQNRLQLVIHTLEKIASEEIDIRQFLPTTSFDTDKMYQDLITCCEKIKNDHIKQICMDTLNDKSISSRLLIMPAAKSIHHAYIGGLLEHTLSICRLMDLLADHYPFLNRDLLIFGALFHDLGKIWELSLEKGIHYTTSGRLVGHLVLCSEYLDKKISTILGFPNSLRDLCKHMVLAHHGKYEFGSPKRPKIIEAYILSMVDELDSKINCLKDFFSNEIQNSEEWSRYHSSFDRYFYLDIFREQESEK